ncbi:uncharacterized protein LOC130670464 [Microplitis mediator]|uniref:uncharacterized protein LOC130670464 n=1 Tax=Microplitis mediator TaxID=375433 RepID=UPI0025531890|nr:uncharacterized protein LOC130670464 [Microplitis mediator]
MVLTEEQTERLTELKRSRGSIKRQITKLTKTVDEFIAVDPAERDFDYLLACLNNVNKHWDKFDSIQFEIEELEPEDTQKADEIQDEYCRVLARVNKLKKEIESTTSQTGAASVTHDHCPTPTPSSLAAGANEIKLPEIPLPTFDVSYEGWSSFIDLFTAIIDDNATMSDARKLQYLRLAVQGKARQIIQSLGTTGQNYKTALELLKNKYDCTRKIIRRHWGLLRDLPRLAKDTPEGLGDLVDNIRQNLRALENLKQPVKNWDTPLIDLILSKISSETAWQWELTLKGTSMPQYTDLLEFLEKRASCADIPKIKPPTQPNNNNHHNNNNHYNRNAAQKSAHVNGQGKEQRQTFVINQYVPCPLCNETHSVRKCASFLAMNPQEREKVITKSSLCFNCLSPTHKARDCNSNNCFKCNKRHHTLLHKPTDENDKDAGNWNPRPNTRAAIRSNNYPTQASQVPETPTNRPMAYVINRPTSDLIITATLHVLN